MLDNNYNNEKLIVLVKKEESVWNIHSEDFLNKSSRLEGWNRIAQKCTNGWDLLSPEGRETAVQDLMKKWAHIRDCYKKEKNTKGGYYSERHDQYLPRKNYGYSDLLGFLDPTFNKKDVTDQVKIRVLRCSIINQMFKTASANKSKELNAKNMTDPQPQKRKYIKSKKKNTPKDSITQNSQSQLAAPQQKLTQTSEQRTEEPKQRLRQSPQLLPTEKQVASGYAGSNPNVAFLFSCLQEMDEMTAREQMAFKLKVMGLLNEIKFPSKIV